MGAPIGPGEERREDRHVRIAMLAYARGMLKLPAFAEVMGALGRESPSSLDAVWIVTGRLGREQLETILLALDGDEPAPSSSAPSTAVQVPIAHFDSTQSVNAPESEAPVSSTTERYVRLRKLGSGGMGDVYECMDHRLGRRVAVKVLRREHEDDPLAMAMLEREARVTGSLEHPNIVPVYDAGRSAGTKAYYAMRLLPQTTLAQVLKRLRARDAATRREYTLGRFLRLFFQVCQAVEYAHSRGIIHCDLKPGNVLLGAFGEVVVADWGLAYSVQDASTFRGGTPGYMAPEQLDASPRGIDARTDVFALGAILYELVSHHSAFPDAPDTALYDGVSEGRRTLRVPPPPSAIAPEKAVPLELDAICLKAIELDPERRYPSASALAAEVETFLEGTKERELGLIRARENARQAHELAENYREFIASRPERASEVARLRAATNTWDPPAQKSALWDAEDRNEVLDALCTRTFQAAVTAYEQALEDSPLLSEARQGLARLYEAHPVRSQPRSDDAVYGGIKLATSPGGAEVVLTRFAEMGRRMVPVSELRLGPSPVTHDALVLGAYVVTLTTRPGDGGPAREVRHPFVVEPGHTIALGFDLRGAEGLAPGEVLVPGGVALLGGDPNGDVGIELSDVHVPPFVIDTLPVSFGEYLAYLEVLFREDPQAAKALLPCGADGTRFWEWTGASFAPGGIL